MHQSHTTKCRKTSGQTLEHTIQSTAIVLPERAQRPSAQVLLLTLMGARHDSHIETVGLLAVLDPLDENFQNGARERSVGLVVAGSTVRSAGNQVQPVPLIQSLDSLLKGHVHVAVHNLTHHPAIVDRGAGGILGSDSPW